jgi:hypothetical protein
LRRRTTAFHVEQFQLLLHGPLEAVQHRRGGLLFGQVIRHPLLISVALQQLAESKTVLASVVAVKVRMVFSSTRSYKNAAPELQG